MLKIKWDQRAPEKGLGQILLQILRKKTHFNHIVQGFLDGRFFEPAIKAFIPPHVFSPYLKNEDPLTIET